MPSKFHTISSVTSSIFVYCCSMLFYTVPRTLKPLNAVCCEVIFKFLCKKREKYMIITLSKSETSVEGGNPPKSYLSLSFKSILYANPCSLHYNMFLESIWCRSMVLRITKFYQCRYGRFVSFDVYIRKLTLKYNYQCRVLWYS